MSPADAALLRKVQARIARLSPALATALLAALKRLQDELSDRDFRALIAGDVGVDTLLSETVIARAFASYRAAIRATVQDGARLSIGDIPRASGPAPSIAAIFDVLDPRVIDAIRSLETAAINTIVGQTKEVLRAVVENGIRDGKNPTAIARDLRQVIGIAPHQERYVANLERELRTLDPAFRKRVLRDHRFDKTISRAIASGKPLTEKQISDMVAAYRKRFAAHNTAVVTRQTTIDAFRTGQRAAWQGAIDAGFVDGDLLERVWVHAAHVKDPRPEHVAMHGERVRWDQPYSNGQMVAGLGDWNCHCADRYVVRRQSAASARNTPRSVLF